MKTLSPIICILGPTNSGKTDLSLRLFDEISADLISVDSVQIYKHADIGSNKISKELQNKYPHELIDIIEPNEVYSVGEFLKDLKVVRSVVPLQKGQRREKREKMMSAGGRTKKRVEKIKLCRVFMPRILIERKNKTFHVSNAPASSVHWLFKENLKEILGKGKLEILSKCLFVKILREDRSGCLKFFSAEGRCQVWRSSDYG